MFRTGLSLYFGFLLNPDFDPYGYLRFFRVIGIQLQESTKRLRRTIGSCETNLEPLALFNFLYAVC